MRSLKPATSFLFFLLSASIPGNAQTSVAAATAARITTPRAQFGHDIGDDYFLANYTQMIDY